MELSVNGAQKRVEVDPERTLLDVLRNELDLTGTKYGCGVAQCGACTVLLDGAPVRSCVTRVDAAKGRAVTTIEGISGHDDLHPLQEAFIEEGALQCGYCTAGMIVAGSALLAATPAPSEAQVRAHMEGHVCRCGTYPRIRRAFENAARRIARQGDGR